MYLYNFQKYIRQKQRERRVQAQRKQEEETREKREREERRRELVQRQRRIVQANLRSRQRWRERESDPVRPHFKIGCQITTLWSVSDHHLTRNVVLTYSTPLSLSLSLGIWVYFYLFPGPSSCTLTLPLTSQSPHNSHQSPLNHLLSLSSHIHNHKTTSSEWHLTPTPRGANPDHSEPTEQPRGPDSGTDTISSGAEEENISRSSETQKSSFENPNSYQYHRDNCDSAPLVSCPTHSSWGWECPPTSSAGGGGQEKRRGRH